jgi:hypothetical protein
MADTEGGIEPTPRADPTMSAPLRGPGYNPRKVRSGGHMLAQRGWIVRFIIFRVTA